MTGVYVGQDEALRGKTAILREVDEDRLEAQFDDISLVELAYTWTEFSADDWEITS